MEKNEKKEKEAMETKQNSQLGFTKVGMKKELSNLGKKEMTQDKKQ